MTDNFNMKKTINDKEYDIKRCADLSDADLYGADLCSADLYGADLCGADLRGANLCGANLRNADLSDANLCGADLRDADLCGANLRDADLCGANLCGANLRGADLRCANLRGANLRDADLCGADFGFEPDKILPKRVAEAIINGADSPKVEMGTWHTCDTVHCLAGWAIHLSGPAGYALERIVGSAVAGVMLLPSASHLFYKDNEAAIAWANEVLSKP
jgi:pentapeptide repeat protein